MSNVTSVYIEDDFGQTYEVVVNTKIRYQPAICKDPMLADSDWDCQDYCEVDIDWETIMVFDEDNYPQPMNLEQTLERLGISHMELAGEIENQAFCDDKDSNVRMNTHGWEDYE